jgi:hypothetical protein
MTKERLVTDDKLKKSNNATVLQSAFKVVIGGIFSLTSQHGWYPTILRMS